MKSTTDFTEIVVFGARGHSLLLLRSIEEEWQGRVRVLALLDDIENGFLHPVLGVPVISSADRLRIYPDVPILLTVGSSALRARMMQRLDDEGATLATLACPGQRHVDPTVEYGAGCLCMPYARIGPNVRIGAGVQLLASAVAHDVVIGDHVTVGFNVCVSGHVEIGEGAHIGPQAVIANGTRARPLRIGAGAVVAVGAAVLRDVPAGARVMGNPAMPVRDWITLQRLLKKKG